MRTPNAARRTLNVELRKCAWGLILLELFCFVLPARAQESGQVSAAAQPLEEGVPEVAVLRLRELLGRDIPDAERIAAKVKLAEALIAAEQPAEALKIIADLALAKRPDAALLQAQANAALARWPDALAAFQRAAADPGSPSRAEALFGQAEALRALGRNEEALQTLETLRTNERWSVRAQLRSIELLLDKQNTGRAAGLLQSLQAKIPAERKERRFLSARIAMAQGKRSRAIALFASILKAPQGAPHSLVLATLVGIADAHLQSNAPGAGDDFLEEFVEHHPSDPDLPKVFAKLDQLYSAERTQTRHELARWSNDNAQPRRALSLWYLARAELRMGHPDLALEAFQQLRGSDAPVSILSQALLEHARLESKLGRFDEALAVLDAARPKQTPGPALEEMNLLAGQIQYRTGRYDAAAQAFEQVAKGDSPFAADALYDVSLSWLQQGDEPHFVAAKEELVKKSGDPQAAADLLLEQGLVEASRNDKQAAESLLRFVRDYPAHPRTAEAWVALAELAFHETPPRIDQAEKHLARAAESRPGEVARERADYLAIWIEETREPTDGAKLIALANRFIEKHPASQHVADVRLKLAETFFRRQDFPSAQTQFEILAQQNPDPSQSGKALFFAAKSSMQSMGEGSLERALVLFDAVVKGNGELKWAARNEQAVIERKLAKPQDALTLYDEVTRGDANASDKREALCGKADVLYELGTTDRENYRRAIELYDQLAAQKGASAHWRNQALFKKGMCLEKLDAPTEALATFYTIVENDMATDRPREFFWFYKAGFNAARLLEEASKWQPAAAIYEKLAFAGGARSEEAKSRLNRLRLEHFLWEQ